jgi:tRNA G18 (ribose-2'-O)-methylase SpoU
MVSGLPDSRVTDSRFSGQTNVRVETLLPGKPERPRNVLLLVGNEGAGIPAPFHRFCDRKIVLAPSRKLHPNVDSLNVSVATALMIQFLRNQLDR